MSDAAAGTATSRARFPWLSSWTAPSRSRGRPTSAASTLQPEKPASHGGAGRGGKDRVQARAAAPFPNEETPLINSNAGTSLHRVSRKASPEPLCRRGSPPAWPFLSKPWCIRASLPLLLCISYLITGLNRKKEKSPPLPSPPPLPGPFPSKSEALVGRERGNRSPLVYSQSGEKPRRGFLQKSLLNRALLPDPASGKSQRPRRSEVPAACHTFTRHPHPPLLPSSTHTSLLLRGFRHAACTEGSAAACPLSCPHAHTHPLPTVAPSYPRSRPPGASIGLGLLLRRLPLSPVPFSRVALQINFSTPTEDDLAGPPFPSRNRRHVNREGGGGPLYPWLWLRLRDVLYLICQLLRGRGAPTPMYWEEKYFPKQTLQQLTPPPLKWCSQHLGFPRSANWGVLLHFVGNGVLCLLLLVRNGWDFWSAACHSGGKMSVQC